MGGYGLMRLRLFLAMCVCGQKRMQGRQGEPYLSSPLRRSPPPQLSPPNFHQTHLVRMPRVLILSVSRTFQSPHIQHCSPAHS